MVIDAEDYISHVGVRGMKWGVRKERLVKKVRKNYGLDLTPAEKKRIEDARNNILLQNGDRSFANLRQAVKFKSGKEFVVNTLAAVGTYIIFKGAWEIKKASRRKAIENALRNMPTHL